MTHPSQSRRIESLITQDHQLRLSIGSTELPAPKADEIIVRVEAAPINPSDLALLLGPADLSTARAAGTAKDPVVSIDIPKDKIKTIQGRIGKPMSVGIEGAGIVVSAGSSDLAQSLIGQTVSMAAGNMLTEYRCVKAATVIPMGDKIMPKQVGSCFVNPMTALSIVEAVRRDGANSFVHTAAASNLGQMLNRVCLDDDVDIVNIVRSPEQEKLLRDIGAKYIVNSASDSFEAELTAAIKETGAYIAFDATGGGALVNTILTCMERAASAGKPYDRYGSNTLKKINIYGRLDNSSIVLKPNFGFTFSINGWLLMPFLQTVDPKRIHELRQRIIAEIKTTFASHYSAEISMQDALTVEALTKFGKIKTGQKVLINPHKVSA